MSAMLLTAADARQLASCCPGLQQLSACGTLRDAAAVAALSALSGLTALLLDGSDIFRGPEKAALRDSDGIGWVQALAQLTGLVDLSFAAPVALGWSKLTRSLKRDMLPLTQLQALTRLQVFDASTTVPRRCLGLSIKAPEGECGSSAGGRDAGPPVWQQLQTYLQGSSGVSA